MDVGTRGLQAPVESRHRPSWLREALIVLAVLLAALCLFYYEVIFLGRMLVPVIPGASMLPDGPYGFTTQARPDRYRPDLGASSWQYEPWAVKVHEEYVAGRLPLWNERQGFGAPLLANAISGAFDVLRLPVLLNSSVVTWDIYYLLRTFLGGLAVYFYSRLIGLRPAVGFLTVIAYSYSGHFLSFGNNLWVSIYFLTPVVLMGTELVLRGRWRTGVLVTALSVGASVLAGMPEATLFSLLLGAAYAGYQWLVQALTTRFSRAAWCSMLGLATGWLAGVGLGMPLILPLFELVPLAHSVHRVDRQLGLAAAPWSDLALLAMPFLRGWPRQSVLPAADLVHIHHYAGSTVLLLAVVGLIPSRTRLYWQVGLFFSLVVALLLAKIHGMPWINQVGLLPGLNVTWIPRWAAPTTGFCLAMLAGMGVQRLLTVRWRLAWVALSLAAFGGFLVLVLWLNWSDVVRLSRWHLVQTVGVALGLSGTLALVILLRPRLPGRVAAWACGLLVLGELLVYAPRDVYQDRYEVLTEPPFVAFLRARLASEPATRVFGIDGIMYPNLGSAMGLNDIRSVEALFPDRYFTYVAHLLAPGASDRYTGAPYSSSEQATLVANNPWFNLTGVRYLLVRKGQRIAQSSEDLIGPIIAANPDQAKPPQVGIESFTIDGVTRTVLFEHAPMELRYPVQAKPEQAMLRFAVALSPKIWAAPQGDGVAFEVIVEANGRREQVYHRIVNPQHTPADRRWLEAAVDLSRYAGRPVVLVFRTDPLADGANDWAGWGDLQLTGLMLANQPAQFVRIYDNEIQILENQQVLPRAFLVDRVEPVADRAAALALMEGRSVDPAHTAVVEQPPAEAVAALRPSGGSVTIQKYTAQQVVIAVQAAEPAFLVLTDAYYPGWVATIDGQETPIYATNLAFRGIFVPAGRHRMEFTYQPLSLALGIGLAVSSVVLLVGVVVSGLLRFTWRTRSSVL